MTDIYQQRCKSAIWPLPSPAFHCCLLILLTIFVMPALIPVDNTLGALFIGTILSSIIYGVTWLQVYSYYNSHCSRDRWPLKSFVAFLMLVDTANLVFNINTNYRIGITNFGDYRSNAFKSWSQPATALSAVILEVFVQHFYAYRIYRLGRGSPYLPVAIVRTVCNLFGAHIHSHEQSAISLTTFGIGTGMLMFLYLWVANALSSSVYTTKVSAIVFLSLSFLTGPTYSLEHIHEQGSQFQELSVAALSCAILCDVLITFGMVYPLLSNRTQVRKTNNVLNLLAIYSLNCGTLHLVFAISSLALLVKYRGTLVYVPSIFIMARLYPCAFMSILNSRDNLRDTLDGPEGVTLTQLKIRTVTTVLRDAQVTMEASTNTTVPKGLPPLSFSSNTSLSDSVIAFDREKHSGPL
ncbi:hypothetical protein H4582DRAFT_2097675 [Lactarius indigo]|nr:hypothetical protein H4582DRAFT_2097675 [Lactarius indigo]